jgi:hypothetical protein
VRGEEVLPLLGELRQQLQHFAAHLANRPAGEC